MEKHDNFFYFLFSGYLLIVHTWMFYNSRSFSSMRTDGRPHTDILYYVWSIFTFYHLSRTEICIKTQFL